MQLFIMLLLFVNVCTVCFLWEVLSNPHDATKTYLFGPPADVAATGEVTDTTTIPAVPVVKPAASLQAREWAAKLDGELSLFL